MTLNPAYGDGTGVILSAPVIKVGADGQSFELNGLDYEDIDSPVGPMTATVPVTGKYLVNYQAHFLCDNSDAVVEVSLRIKIGATPVANSEVIAFRAESASLHGDERLGAAGTMALSLTEGDVVEMQANASANTGVTSVTGNTLGRTKLELIHYG